MLDLGYRVDSTYECDRVYRESITHSFSQSEKYDLVETQIMVEDYKSHRQHFLAGPREKRSDPASRA